VFYAAVFAFMSYQMIDREVAARVRDVFASHWRMSFTSALHRAFTNAHFKGLGLPAMEKLVKA
jgi:hypothetical protein